jgi:hypothetical protein
MHAQDIARVATLLLLIYKNIPKKGALILEGLLVNTFKDVLKCQDGSVVRRL